MDSATARVIWNRIKHDSIIIHVNMELGKYFYSTSHCQGVIRTWLNPDGTVGGDEKHWLGSDKWVACTTTIPYPIVPRPAFPDGLIKTKEENAKLHYSDYEEIPNPEPEYQP